MPDDIGPNEYVTFGAPGRHPGHDRASWRHVRADHQLWRESGHLCGATAASRFAWMMNACCQKKSNRISAIEAMIRRLMVYFHKIHPYGPERTRMKLIIQIPCYNEAEPSPTPWGCCPLDRGIDQVEVLVIDDGSRDDTVEAARAAGADHIVQLPHHTGLAGGFCRRAGCLPAAGGGYHRQHRCR